MIRVRTRLVLPWRRRRRPQRGTQRLLADLAALQRLTGPQPQPAWARVEAAVGPALAAELERRLGVEARTPRRRLRRLLRAA